MTQTHAGPDEMKRSEQRTSSFRIFSILFLVSLVCSLAAAVAGKIRVSDSVMQLSYLAGPTTDSLLHGRGLTACTERMGTPGNPICFHAGRMPVVSVVLASAVLIVGDHLRRVILYKTLLLLTPVEAAIYLACLGLPQTRRRRVMAVLLLLAPFVITQFLVNVVGVHVEENYTYAFLAFATAAVLFRDAWVNTWPKRNVLLGALTGVAIALVYLSKSSMMPAALVLLIAFVWRERSWAGALAVALALAAPVSWGLYQHHAAGRFTIGTSMDGLNFHKGNSAIFEREYPPRPPHETLDDFDPELNHGHYFPDEWTFNDFHRRAAKDYIEAHPRKVAAGLLKKLEVFFLSVKKSGSKAEHGAMLVLETGGWIFFRILFWICLAIAVSDSVRGKAERQADALFYLLLVTAVAAPYLAGFGYTRHVSVLIYPTVLLCVKYCHDIHPWRIWAGRREPRTDL